MPDELPFILPRFPPVLPDDWLWRELKAGAEVMRREREGNVERVVLQRPGGIPYHMRRLCLLS